MADTTRLAAHAAGLDEGARRERAAVVAWLRETSAKLKAVAPDETHVMRVGDEAELLATAIEQGKHLEGGGDG